MSLNSQSQIPGWMCLRNPLKENFSLIRQSSGFALLTTLILAPVLLIVLSWLSLQLLQLSELKKDRQLCRAQLVLAQESVGHHLNDLLALNSRAQYLRSQLLLAKAALASALATANAPGATAARGWIQRIQFQKHALIFQQKKLIWSSRMELTKALYELQFQLQNRANRISNQNRKFFNLHQSSFGSSSVRVAVKRFNSPDPFPEYELTPDFSKRQSLGLKWQSHFEQKARGLKKWIPFDQKKSNQCAVSLTVEGPSFQAIPSQDKYF